MKLTIVRVVMTTSKKMRLEPSSKNIEVATFHVNNRLANVRNHLENVVRKVRKRNNIIQKLFSWVSIKLYTMHLIFGTIRSTPTHWLLILSNILPSDRRRKKASHLKSMIKLLPTQCCPYTLPSLGITRLKLGILIMWTSKEVTNRNFKANGPDHELKQLIATNNSACYPTPNHT